MDFTAFAIKYRRWTTHLALLVLLTTFKRLAFAQHLPLAQPLQISPSSSFQPFLDQQQQQLQFQQQQQLLQQQQQQNAGFLSSQQHSSAAALPILQQRPVIVNSATARQQRIYSAIFNQKGLKGTISFRQQPNTVSGITIVVHLHSTPDIHNIRWEIHEFPVDWTEKALCSDLGLIAPNGDLTSRHGLLSTNMRSEFRDSLLQLGSIESIWMRSVVLIASNGDRVCATIRAGDDDPLIMVAIVNGRVAGEIVFMQPYSTTAGNTNGGSGGTDVHLRVLTNLYYTDGNTVRSQLAWDLRSDPTSPRGGASHIADCSRLTQRTTDLNRILGPAPVGERKSSARISISSEVLALRTLANSGSNLYVVVHDTVAFGGGGGGGGGSGSRQQQQSSTAGMAISCGYLQEIKPKQVRATFAMQGVSGAIVFTQNSRWDATRIDAQLNGLRGVAGPYHIHEWPIEPIDPANVHDSVNICNAPFTGQHYNPHSIDPAASPAAGQGTHDQYQVGDLGGKHGLLSGAVAYSGTFFDDNLSLFGPLSIVGRSVVLHAQQTGERFACADIGYPARTQNAVARLELPLKGQIIFRQPMDDNFADTTVLVSLQYAPSIIMNPQQQSSSFQEQSPFPSPAAANILQRQQRQVLPSNNRFLAGGGGSVTATEHDWGIHWSPVSIFDQLAPQATSATAIGGGRCLSASTVYNPYFIDAQHMSYNEQCTRNVPLRCQMGDLGAKLGRFSVATGTDLPTKTLFTDMLLPIGGPLGIAGRSLVIMDAGGDSHNRLACANITRF